MVPEIHQLCRFAYKCCHTYFPEKPVERDFERRVAFKNILSQDEELRLRYENLKIQLVEEHAKDREMYTDAKAAFIGEVLD